MTCTQVTGFQPRKNSDVDVVVPCVIKPPGNSGMMVQPIGSGHDGFITLHIGGRHVHQAGGAVVDLCFHIHQPTNNTDKDKTELSQHIITIYYMSF